MRKNLPLELSFVQEGKNAEKISNMLQHFSWLVVPIIYWKHTTERVLIMEYVEGIHINDIENLKKAQMDLLGISKNISQMYAEMIFKYGYVHCDPHPGNVLVRKNSNGKEEIVLLDHGLYTVSITKHK
jgi:aarF domain-containing kinase